MSLLSSSAFGPRVPPNDVASVKLSPAVHTLHKRALRRSGQFWLRIIIGTPTFIWIRVGEAQRDQPIAAATGAQ